LKQKVWSGFFESYDGFLSYYPLKQGLKPMSNTKKPVKGSKFLSYYPLKQGLKQLNEEITKKVVNAFLSYYPLKQGLKQNWCRIKKN